MLKFSGLFVPARPLIAGCVLGLALFVHAAPAQAQWGTLSGTVTFKGTAPAPKLIHAKGAAGVKDGEVCAANDMPDESLVVNAKNNGVANVFIYLKKAEKIHPVLAKSKEPTVTFDQKGCQFIPHALVVRTDQKVKVLSADGVAHNTHSYPIKNKAVNFVVSPNDRAGAEVPGTIVEKLPFKVGCDIHSWMTAQWLVVDHPYATVTDVDGKFKIENLPVGELEFVVWQESVGYVEKSLKLTIKAGENTKDISSTFK